MVRRPLTRLTDTMIVFFLLVPQAYATPAIRLITFLQRSIENYKSYADVNMLHAHLDEHVVAATWTLAADEVNTKSSIASVFTSCPPRRITAYFKPGSFPVVSPDGSFFPKNYVIKQPGLDKLQLYSDGTSYTITFTNPKHGDWFAAVFNDYTDPGDQAISQAGLALECSVKMNASLDVTLVDKLVTLRESQPLQHHTLLASAPTVRFKIFVPPDVSRVRVGLGLVEARTFLVGLESGGQGNGVTVTTSRAADNARRCTSGHECSICFVASGDTWYYVTVVINPTVVERAQFKMEVGFERLGESSGNETNLKADGTAFPDSWEKLALKRYSFDGFFSFGFGLKEDFENTTEAVKVSISTKNPTAAEFIIQPIIDIGGVLMLQIKFPNTTSYQYPVTIIACLTHERLLAPKYPGTCIASDSIETPTPLKITSSDARVQSLSIPFPQPGPWHLSLMPYCLDLTDGVLHTPCDADTVEVMFVIASLPCHCVHGECWTKKSGGLFYALCKCNNGYQGWACDEYTESNLFAVLLLTFSNFFFLVVVVVAIRRKFYTVAFLFGCVFFFSTFYHACIDGDEEHSFCLLRGGVLQDCDFFVALLSLWVTAILLADLPPKWTTLAHMIGTVFIAMGIAWDRTALWIAAIPTVIGLAVIGFSWGSYMRATKSCYPSGKYWKFNLPAGFAMLMVAVVCYSFLETEGNYEYVHSFWHFAVAISVTVLIWPLRPGALIRPAAGGGEPDGGGTETWSRGVAKFCSEKFAALRRCRRKEVRSVTNL